MRQIGLIGVILVLIVALAMLNKEIGKNAGQGTDNNDAAKQSQPQKPTTSPSGAKTGIPPEGTIGNMATAKYKIAVGWQYDAANQAKPEALNQALGAVVRFVNAQKGTAAAEIVDLDIPAAERSPAARAVTDLGVTVNGKSVPGLTSNLGEGSATAANIPGALQAVTR